MCPLSEMDIVFMLSQASTARRSSTTYIAFVNIVGLIVTPHMTAHTTVALHPVDEESKIH
jgi:hypothetical protein